MLTRIKNEIPDFIIEYLVYCDIFVDYSRQKTCLVLTKNLKFFEYKQKQLVASIDLDHTCLHKVLNKLKNYTGPKCKRLKGSASDEPTSSTQTPSYSLMDGISFGKYAYNLISIQKIYLLIQCWDKLLILQRFNNYLKDFQLIDEYEGVLSFRLVHGPIKYCPVLEIKFENGRLLKTDFQESVKRNTENEFVEQHLNDSEFKQLMDNIRSAKTELQLHQSITGRTFRQLHNKLTFGVPYIRSLKLEEKQLLSRCGDIWKRFTLHDHLVIGVPVVNQSSPPNLTILRNLQPLIQFEPSESCILHCEYRLYQLKRTFEELDSIEAFLETEDVQLQANVWLPEQHLQLLPDSFAILLIKFQLSDIINLNRCPLILTYEIVKDFPLTPHEDNSKETYPLQLVLDTLDFYRILNEQRQKYEISFNRKTLNQDFLAIAMTSMETVLTFTFCNQYDLDTFSRLIKEKYDFDSCPNDRREHEMKTDHDEEEPEAKTSLSTASIFYNRKPQSLWFGCLVLYHCSPTRMDKSNHLETVWKFYHIHVEKAVMFLKLLFTDLVNGNCNILKVERSPEQVPKNSLMEFENALRLELDALRNFLSAKAEEFSNTQLQLSKNFFKLQLHTDLVLQNVNAEGESLN
ncbi:uncharacterized protein LOC119644725 [Glossina fuscipes]|uniref:Uncharacterized protein LOC119644725 n=1 Tax=Glossina fuscipes TaxID=7396 RepID=A0A9C5ZK51_9MUSC|nr:uncharacterized protein LOC119644725 [Glossina fuscipes]KAI9588862.1 hypothetical protein GQX74_007031 [Glossina fuscipes]